MFTGLSPTYSLVNVAADQIRMLLDAGIEVRMLVSETCPDRERTGIFLDPRVEWVRVVNTRQGSPITWYDYSGSIGRVHDSFFEEADLIARDLVRCLDGVDFCLMHDILYQGWHLVHNIAVRKAQEQLPGVRFVEFTHSLPLLRPEKLLFQRREETTVHHLLPLKGRPCMKEIFKEKYRHKIPVGLHRKGQFRRVVCLFGRCRHSHPLLDALHQLRRKEFIYYERAGR